MSILFILRSDSEVPLFSDEHQNPALIETWRFAPDKIAILLTTPVQKEMESLYESAKTHLLSFGQNPEVRQFYSCALPVSISLRDEKSLLLSCANIMDEHQYG